MAGCFDVSPFVPVCAFFLLFHTESFRMEVDACSVTQLLSSVLSARKAAAGSACPPPRHLWAQAASLVFIQTSPACHTVMTPTCCSHPVSVPAAELRSTDGELQLSG